MKENKATNPDQSRSTGLHQRAEETLSSQPINLSANPDALSLEDMQCLVHELQMHQIELETQNEELRRTQQELTQSRDKYSDLYDLAPVGYFTVDENGIILEANLTGATMLGMEKGDVIEQPLSRFIAREDQDTYYLHRQKVFETQASQACEIRLVRKDGAQFHARIETTVVPNRVGDALVCQAVVSDISKRKVLEENWKQYEFIANISKEFMTLIGEGYIYEAVNEAYCQAHNKTREEIIGSTVADVWGEERFNTTIKEYLDECFAGNEVRHQAWFEFSALGLRYFEVIYYPHRDNEGTVTHIAVVSRDITERRRAEEEIKKLNEELEQRVAERTAELLEANVTLRKQISEREQAEEKLRESEVRYRSLFDRVPVGLYRTTPAGQVVDVNPTLVQILGYPDRESLLVVNTADNYVDIEDRQRWQTLMEYEDIVNDFETQWRQQDGTAIWVRESTRTVRDAGGRVLYYEGTAADVTERRQAQEETLRLNQKLLSLQFAGATIAASLDLQYILNTVTREMVDILAVEGCAIFEWNQAVDTISLVAKHNLSNRQEDRSFNTVYKLADFPLSKQVLVKRRVEQMTISQANSNPDKLAYMQATQTKTLLMLPMESQDYVVGLVEMTDTRIERTFVLEELALIQLMANQTATALRNARLYDQAQQELAERKQTERELRQSEARNRALLDAIPDLMFRITAEGVFLDFNSSNLDDLYAPPEEFLGKQVSEVLPPDLAELIMRYIDRTLASGIMQVFEYKLPLPQGTQDFEARYVPSGPNEVLAIVRNITAREQAEEQLRKLSRAVEQSPSIVLITDTKGDIEYVNPKFTQATGYTLEEVIGKNSRILKSGEMPPEAYKQLWETITSGNEWQGTFHNKKKNGERYWASASISPIRDSEGSITHFLSVQEDTTKRREAEEALQRSEANLKAIFDNSLQPFILIDRDHKVQAFNRIISEAIKLVSKTEIREGDSIYDFIPAEYVENFDQSFKKALNGKPVSTEENVKVGHTDNWYETQFNPVFAGDGLVIGVCVSAIDIDEYKNIVDTLTESEARLLAEMQSVLIISRALVSEIDLNNLLELIMTQAQHLTDTDGTTVLLLSDDGHQLEVAPPGESWLRIKAGSRLPVHGSLAGLALVSQKVQISNHPQDDDWAASICALLQPAEIHSLLCAPLVAQDKNLGILLIWNEHGQVFTEPDSRLIKLFADQSALALHNAHLHTQNRQLAIEQERRRLARELHDSVTQSLYSIGLAAQTSLRLFGQDTDSGAREPIEYIQTLSQTTLTEMKEQLYRLHPTVLNEKGLVKALAQHCEALSGQYSLTIEFTPDLEPPLPALQQEGLYYIAREALWNIVKHADATHVKIVLARENDQIILSIVDDGVGLDLAALVEDETMGLRNMKERAKLLEGAFELQSGPGEGTRLTVQIPTRPY